VGGHQSDPGALLGLTRLAGLPVPEAFVVTVPAHDLGLGAGLSAATQAAVTAAVTEVLRLCPQAHDQSDDGEDDAVAATHPT
jgi:hypothetical protein